MDISNLDLANEKTYDSAFWTCLDKLRKYVIPLVNEVFGEHFTEHAKVVIKNNKHIVEQTDWSLRQLDTDGYVGLSEASAPHLQSHYHFECEAWYERGIAVRIEEYEASIAMENIQSRGNVINVYHPKSAVIFLHADASIPEKFLIRHWDTERASFMEMEVPALQIRDYPVETVFAKQLLLLLPFYAFHYSDRELAEMNAGGDAIQCLKDGLDGINARLTALVRSGAIDAAQKGILVRMIKRVFDKRAIQYANVTKGVAEIMGGYILRTDIDEIFDGGVAKGRLEGRLEGRHEGRLEGRHEGKVEEYIELRREDGYSDAQLVDGIVERFHIGIEEARRYVQSGVVMS